jgi:alpha-tubulin suppressor-like RCC1 family protein
MLRLPGFRLFAFALILSLSACKEDVGPIPSGLDASRVLQVRVTPALDTLFVADTLRSTDVRLFNAEIIGTDRSRISGVKAIWVSEDSSVAVVDDDGVLHPRRFGTTRIYASAGVKGYATVVIAPATRRIVISPRVDTIFVDNPISRKDSLRLAASAFDDSSRLIAGTRFVWTSEAPSVATVDSAGIVRAVGVGSVSVTAVATSVSAAASVVVLPLLKDVAIVPPVTPVLAFDTVRLVATARAYDDSPVLGRKFVWSSSDSAIAIVDSTGRLVAKAAGIATITASTAFRSASFTLTVLDRNLVALQAGGDYSCGRTVSGRLYCWGRGSAGQLATSTDSLCFDSFDGTPARVGCALSPKRDTTNSSSFKFLALGGAFGCGITIEQLAYCWGSDSHGQIGNGSSPGGGAKPQLVTVRGEQFVSISAGAAHACALTSSGKAYCWGRDSTGQLGDARRVNSTTPIPVYPEQSFRSISAGGFHTCAIRTDGQALCWGFNLRGQLGSGSAGGIVDSPSAAVPGGTYTSISAGYQHTCAIRSDGVTLCWGDNTSGQLGASSVPDSVLIVPTPTAVTTAIPFALVVAGGDAPYSNTCALDAVGVAYCWGDNSWKQSGSDNAAVVRVRIPTIVPGQPAGNFTSLSIGFRHACAFGTQGGSWCWGSNVFGALGTGLQGAGRATPQTVERPR